MLSIIQLLLYIDSAEEVVSLFEVELQKPRNLSAHESEKCEHGKGVGVHATLLQSDTVHPYGRAKAGTRPLGVELRKKPKDLSAHDMRVKSVGMGRVLVCMLLCCSQIHYL